MPVMVRKVAFVPGSIALLMDETVKVGAVVSRT